MGNSKGGLKLKVIRAIAVFTLLAAYIVLAVCDFKEGQWRTGVVSTLFAAVTWLIFF